MHLDEDAQYREDINAHGNVHPPKRIWEARQKVYFKVPLPAWFQDDMSKAVHVQGLTQKITFDFDLERDANLIQTDGTSTNIFLSDPAAYFNTLTLQAEYYHVLRKERDQGIKLMAAPNGLRYLFDSTQVNIFLLMDAAMRCR